jgi:hypothetical protein
VLNENTTKSIELKLAEVRSLVDQVDESVTILYLIDMILSEARSISSNTVSTESKGKAVQVACHGNQDYG